MKIIVLSMLLLLYSCFCFAQNEQEVPFLLIPSSAEMNGMGDASVAHITDNPAALITNPAQLGMQCLDNSILALSKNYSGLTPLFGNSRWALTSLLNVGTNLKKYYPNLPSISVGLSYSNVYVTLGPMWEPFDYPGIPETMTYESNQVTLSLAADYFIRASIGLTYKNIYNKQHQPTAQESGDFTVIDQYDLGLLIEVPFAPLISNIMNQSIPSYNNVSPVFNLNLGISENNIGMQSIFDFWYPEQANPFPRFARMGMELNPGLIYVKDNMSWVPVSFKWNIESNDLLEKEDNTGNISNQSGLGAISFLREVILGKSNKETEKLKGWELNLGEAIYIYGGSYTEDPIIGNNNFISEGYAISIPGIFKSIAVLQPDILRSKFVRSFINNVVLKFNESRVYTFDASSPLNNSKCYSLSVTLKNLL
jgi:hypothetical protein